MAHLSPLQFSFTSSIPLFKTSCKFLFWDLHVTLNLIMHSLKSLWRKSDNCRNELCGRHVGGKKKKKQTKLTRCEEWVDCHIVPIAVTQYTWQFTADQVTLREEGLFMHAQSRGPLSLVAILQRCTSGFQDIQNRSPLSG